MLFPEDAAPPRRYNPAVRLLLLALLAFSASAAEQPYPLWDGQETIEAYAKRANLEPTKTLGLGNGVKLELVLLPAGKFVMGTPEPTPVDEEGFGKKIIIGQAVLAAGVGALLFLLGAVVIRAVRQWRRPQYSLARLVVMTVVAGVALLGGLHWHFSARGLTDAKAEHAAALARYKEADESEKPAHEVTLTKPFYLGKFEVTQEQYQQVMGTNPSHSKGLDLPVEQVSWDDAQEFCRKARERTGLAVRLLTQAEWEHACRAGTRTTYHTGDAETDLDRAAWHYRNSGNRTHPVGQKAPNTWGLYDMHGNVWEWCADYWCRDYGAEAATDPLGAAQGRECVLRGGCWDNHPTYCRSANRIRLGLDYRSYGVGFRVASSLPSKAP
jgi:formylglycine-generating enzyme required for sulfatase activity